MRQAPAAVGEAVPMNVGGKCISNKTLYLVDPGGLKHLRVCGRTRTDCLLDTPDMISRRKGNSASDILC